MISKSEKRLTQLPRFDSSLLADLVDVHAALITGCKEIRNAPLSSDIQGPRFLKLRCYFQDPCAWVRHQLSQLANSG
jgi:hypothetical protein